MSPIHTLVALTGGRTWFLRQWPAGSDAHASCCSRITGGPSYRPEDAVRIEE